MCKDQVSYLFLISFSIRCPLELLKLLRLKETKGGRTDKDRHLCVLGTLAIMDFFEMSGSIIPYLAKL